MASFKCWLILLVCALSLLGCTHNWVKIMDSKVTAARLPAIGEKSSIEENTNNSSLTADDRQRPSLVFCKRKTRDLSMLWDGRQYWCDKKASKMDAAELKLSSSGSYKSRNLAATKALRRPVLMPPVVTSTDVTSPVVAGIKISDNPDREDKAAHSHTPVRYNYNVVYVFSDSQSWWRQWHQLEALSEMDKWKGINRQQGTYFIYAGVYMQIKHAQARQADLAAKTEQTPQIRKRSNSEVTR